MSWTPEDERRYQELKRQQEARQAQQQVEAAHARRRSASASEEVEQEFSLSRMLGGAVQDTFNALRDTADYFSSGALGATNPFGQARQIIKAATDTDILVSKMDVVGDSTNTVESIGRSITGFLIPYTGAAKVTKAFQAAPLSTRIGREVAAVSLVSMTAMDAQENNIANTLRDGLGVDNAVIDALVTEEDDGLMEGRLKATIANLPLELAGAGIFEGAAAGIRALRATRKINQQQRDMIDAVKEDLTVKALTPKPVEPKAPKASKETTEEVFEESADESLTLEAKSILGGFEEASEKTATVPVSQVKPKEVKTMGELTDYLKELVDGVPVGQEAYLEKLAKALIENPHKALSELDIDPVKLDLTVLDDPSKIVALQNSLGDVMAHVANRTGRTGKVVPNKETIRTARMLGSSPAVIARLAVKTKSLPTDLMAARMIVGANAHKLVSSVDAAIAEINSGVTRGPAWTQFTKDLGQHGLLLGTLRGAGSEIARALQTLRAEVPVTGAGKLADDAVDGAEKADKFAEAYEALFKDLGTDAGRLRLLQRLKDADGDIEDLHKIVRSRQVGRLQWVDNAIKETKGNLFSLGTSLYNVGSAGFMMGYKTVSHMLAAGGLGAAGMVTGNQAVKQAAQKQLYKFYANINAPIMAMGKAINGTWKVLQKEGLEEIAALADTLGAEDFAKGVQKAANEAGEGLERGWLKKDMSVGERAIYIKPETVRKITQQAEKYPIGKMGQLGIEWLVKTAATSVNVFGAGTRLSLTAFISAPDTFAGTLAAQAGKSTKAIELAADEAVEAGLTGSALTDYIKARAIDLEKLVDEGTSADAFDDAAKDLMERAGNDYAREINFADELETKWLNSAAAMFENMPLAGSMIMPFPRTPLRVMERTVIDYTPLGFFKQRVRDMWTSGDPDQMGEVAARMTMSLAMIGAAWQLAGDRTIVGNDGGWNNTARRERGTYTIKIGDDVHEFNRLDPIGTILGLAADARATWERGADTRRLADGPAEYMGELSQDIFEAMLWPTVKNIFNKAYLESLSTIMEVTEADTPEQQSSALGRYLASSATRFVPASGFQRQQTKMDDGIVRASRGLVDGWLKASWGADKLPPRLDNIFGRPLEYLDGERMIGWKGGPIKADPIDREIARLAFDMRPPRRNQNGVELNQRQYNRLLELRGHEVKLGGMTLEERIVAMIEDKRWETTPDPAKVEMIKSTITPYSRAAKQALLREDKEFARESIRMELREKFSLQGKSLEQADAESARLAEELGLNPTN